MMELNEKGERSAMGGGKNGAPSKGLVVISQDEIVRG